MAWEKSPGAGSLYRVTPDGAVEVVEPAVTISNGIDCSPDGSRVYYNDTGTGRTDVFDHRDGSLRNRRPFHDGDSEGDHPDGLCVDSAGNVWVALYGAGLVRCYSPGGQVLHEVELPARQVTACTFGGEDLRDLYVTTSRENLEGPRAGGRRAVPREGGRARQARAPLRRLRLRRRPIFGKPVP